MAQVTLGHANYAVTDRVYAHVRKRDWTAERLRIIAAGSRQAVAPIALRGVSQVGATAAEATFDACFPGRSARMIPWSRQYRTRSAS
jgi:hypothetical protein